MTIDLESEVSRYLAQRAASISGGAAERLRTVDYRPRTGRRVPVTAGALAGVATVGTVLSVTVLGGTTAAYAGWSPTPDDPASTSAPSATSSGQSCQGQLDALSTMRGTAPDGASAPMSPGGSWTSILSDVRGPFTVNVLQNGDRDAACFTGPTFSEVNELSTGSAQSSTSVQGSAPATGSDSGSGSAAGSADGATGAMSSEILTTASGDLAQVQESHLTTADGPYTFVDGRTGSGVTAVTLDRSDGQNVVATVAAGWFVAWWPGSASTGSARVTTASGTVAEALQRTGPSTTPPAVPGTSGNSGSTGSGGTTGNSGVSGSGSDLAPLPSLSDVSGAPGSAVGPSLSSSAG